MRHLLFAALLLLCCAYGCIAETEYGTPYPHDRDVEPIPETEDSFNWSTKVVDVVPQGEEGANGKFPKIRFGVNPSMIGRALTYCVGKTGKPKMTRKLGEQVCDYVKEKGLKLAGKLLSKVVEKVVHKAVKKHADSIKVKPGKRPMMPNMAANEAIYDKECAEMVYLSQRDYRRGNLDADFMIFLGLSTERPGAKTCTRDENGRPTSAIVKLNPYDIADTEEYVHVVARDIAHGLGIPQGREGIQEDGEQ